MTKYKRYSLHLEALQPAPFNARDQVDAVRRAVRALQDFQPHDGHRAVTDRLGRAREVARAVETLYPHVAASVESVDTRDA